MYRCLSRIGMWIAAGISFTAAALTVLVLAQAAERKFWPVVEYKSEITERTADAVTIHIYGHKWRDCECVKNSLQSYAVRNGVKFDIQETRVSGDGSCRPVGAVDLGSWSVYPIAGAQKIIMTFTHSCDGRYIKAIIADVKL